MKKKTIAILLVLVIGMVGVFAEGNGQQESTVKELKLTTTVPVRTGFKVTNSEILSYDTFKAANHIGAVTVTVAETGGTQTLSSTLYLTVVNNAATPYKIGVQGLNMTSSSTSSSIKYTYTVGEITTAESSVATLGSYKTAVTAQASSTTTEGENPTTTYGGIDIKSKQITITLDSDDFNAAGSGSYTGTLYFDIVTI